MAVDSLVVPNRKTMGWYEIAVPVRGCVLSMEVIKEVYKELNQINKDFGGQVLSGLQRNEDMTNEQWQAHTEFLLQDVFRLTVTIEGVRDQQLYGDTVEVFDDENLPKPIKSIFFTNATAFRERSNGVDPRNQLSVYLDFGKPDLLDPNPLVSAATPNGSEVNINAQDITFYNAVQNTIEKKLLVHKTWYAAIHRNFSYDAGIWIFALPFALYFSVYFMDQIIPRDSNFEIYRWPLFLYFVGLSLIFYRALIAYTKWAFPVNVLLENKDRSRRHRIVLGLLALWLASMVAATIYEMMIT